MTKQHKLYKAYMNQKGSAKHREVEFLLSFQDWLDIWNESGKLHLRGRGHGKYVMARKEDSGPYSKHNVVIITNADNVSQGSVGMIPWNKGRTEVYSEEALDRMREPMMKNKRHLKRKTYGNRYRKGIPKKE